MAYSFSTNIFPGAGHVYLKQFACVLIALTTLGVARADDWPQWMGPSRDGEYRETGLIGKFPSEGATILWRAPIAGGYAGPAVADGRVFVFDYDLQAGEIVNDSNTRTSVDGHERVHCLNPDTGQILWQHAYDCPYSISYPAGPRCTPTVDGNRVYTLGSQGDLHCLDTATGTVIWSVNFVSDFGADVPLWGFASHPLVDNDLLICMVGGPGQTVVAFEKATGQVRWKALSASAVGYCPPSIIEAGGQRQLIVWHADAIHSLDPADGSVFWTVPIKASYEMAVTRPQRWKDLLYASAIGNNAVMLRLRGDSPEVEELWSGEPKSAVYCGNSTPIFFEGTVFGTDCQEGCMVAVGAEKGDRLWTSYAPTRIGETRRVNHGTAFITHLADTSRYLIFSETGEMIIAEMTAAGYREISRAQVIEPTGEAFGRKVVWSHPAYANQTAFVRNDKEIVAVSLRAEGN